MYFWLILGGTRVLKISNMFISNQRAIDRVHRLGQTREVIVKRFIIKNSVEENILKIQKKKSALAGAVTSSHKITIDDLVGLFN